MLQEFKPTLLFLARFFAIYLVFSAVYGVIISRFDSAQKLDPVTRTVTRHCAGTAQLLGYQTHIEEDDHLRYEKLPDQTFDSIWLNDVYAVSVEEGCNGINMMILFVAFVVGFGGKLTHMLIFIPLGLFFIHVANLGRLLFLSLMNVEWAGRGFHFFHKYGFTAVLYLAILLLWFLWVMYFNGRKASAQKKEYASNLTA